MNISLTRISSNSCWFHDLLALNVYTFRKQLIHIQIFSVLVALANSTLYFIHGATFSLGAKLVKDGHMQYDQVFRLDIKNRSNIQHDMVLRFSRIYCVMVFTVFAIGRSLATLPDYGRARRAGMKILQLDKRKSEIDPNDQDGIILVNSSCSLKIHHGSRFILG